MRNWLLPEFIEDVLPKDAAQIEMLRRRLLDLFKVNGYQYVIPPTLEYLESLITGTGHDLDLATFKVVDQLTGRLMGIRADTTPQAARIDAHMLNHQGISRLCYAGTVVRTHPSGLARTREPLQLGAELFGHGGLESDIEIQRLMINALQALGLSDLHIDFSHVAIFESLVQAGKINAELELALYGALQSKDKASVAQLANDLEPTIKLALISLTDLNGDIAVLSKAQSILPNLPAIDRALTDLHTVATKLADMNVQVSVDLSELRGYHYHSGIVFAAYAQGYAGPLALGGRYDEVGIAFGRSRPATGFSIDLRGAVSALPPAYLSKAILAPDLTIGDDGESSQIALNLKVESLRAQGLVVINVLPNSKADALELNCDRHLVLQNNEWVIEALK